MCRTREENVQDLQNEELDEELDEELEKLLDTFGVENTLETLSNIFAERASALEVNADDIDANEANVCKIISYYLAKAACVEADGYTMRELNRIKRLEGKS